MNKRRLLAFIVCCFGFTPVAFGGLVALCEYKIEIKGEMKSVLILSTVHEPDLKHKTFILDDTCQLVFDKTSYDHSGHLDVFKDLTIDKKDGEGDVSVLLELTLRRLALTLPRSKAPLLSLFELQLARKVGFGGRKKVADSNKGLLPTKRVGRYNFVCADIRDERMSEFAQICRGKKIKGFVKNHIKNYYPRYKKIQEDFCESVGKLGKQKFLEPVSTNAFDITKTQYLSKPPPGIPHVQWLPWLTLVSVWPCFEALHNQKTFKRAAAERDITQECLQLTLREALTSAFPHMYFFTTCVNHLLKKDVKKVILIVGQGHGSYVGKMLCNCGAKLVQRVGPFHVVGKKMIELELHKRLEDKATVAFLKPFHLRCFLTQALIGQTDSTSELSLGYCDYCGMPSDRSQEGLRGCSKCKTVSYCSRPCQVRDWLFHKGKCHRFKQK